MFTTIHPTRPTSFPDALTQLRDESEGPLRHYLDSLLAESDSELLLEDAYHLAQSSEWEGDLPTAARLYEMIERGASVPTEFQNQAHERRQILEGTGGGWAQWHHDAQQLISRFDVGCFVGILVGGLAFRGAARLAQTHFASALPPLGLRFASGGAGFFAESVAFAATTRGVNHLFGVEQSWNAAALSRDLFRAMLFLGPFHIGRYYAGRAAPALAARMRSRYPNEPELVLSTVTWHLTQQLMFLGAIASQQVEESRGWRPHRPYEELLLNGALRLIQYHFAHATVNRFLGAQPLR